MKWMWSWHDHTQSWWKQPSQMANDKDRPWNNPHSSRFWKNIKSISPVFNCSIRYQIGDGKATTFWHDNWCGDPLKYVYPNLYEAVQDKDASVCQCHTENGWLSQLQPLNSLAQREKDQMALDVQCPPLTQNCDSIVWLRNSATFSVSSAYHFLSHSPSPTSNLHNIWTIKAPLRVTVFIWLMLSNRLTTTDNLIKRGWQLPNMCVLCKRSEETAKHIFQTCSLVKEHRNYIHSTTPAHHAASPKYKTEFSFDVLTDPIERKSARQWELVTCFVVWRERCRRLFSEKCDSQMALVREIRTELKYWFY